MPMANLLVILIVFTAGTYSIRWFYKRLKTQQGCCCECFECTVEKPSCKESEMSVNDMCHKVEKENCECSMKGGDRNETLYNS